MDAASKQWGGAQYALCETVLKRQAHYCTQPSSVFSGSRPMWIRPVPKSEKCIKSQGKNAEKVNIL